MNWISHMIDQHFDRTYRSGRAALNRDLTAASTGLVRTIGDGLSALHRFEWSAPWARPTPPQECR